MAGSKLRGRTKKSWSFSPTSSLIQVVKRCRIHNKFLDGKLKVGAEWSMKIEKKSHFKCLTNRGYFVCNYMDSQPTLFLHCGGAEHSICCKPFFIKLSTAAGCVRLFRGQCCMLYRVVLISRTTRVRSSYVHVMEINVERC